MSTDRRKDKSSTVTLAVWLDSLNQLVFVTPYVALSYVEIIAFCFLANRSECEGGPGRLKVEAVTVESSYHALLGVKINL